MGGMDDVVATAEPERFPARLLSRRDAGGGLSWVSLLPSPKAAATYRSPGQYVDVRIGDATGFFALASREGAGQWDLLLRPQPGASQALCTLPPGAHVMVSAALGAGFPFDAANERTLAIVVTAGALAPALPTLERRLREGMAERTTLLVGTHSLAGVPAMAELEEIRGRGGRVKLVLSEEIAPPHAHGFVQDLLGDVRPEIVFAAGMPAMMDAVREWGKRHDVEVKSNH